MGISPVKLAVSSAALFLSTAEAFWRLPCQARSGVGRLDPLVDPGKPADHVHVIHGGNNFGFDTSYDDLMKSEGTSCEVTQDKSAYWTPALYFQHANGSTEMVEEHGGMLAYYLLYGDNIKAFPAGFRMLAGDTLQRNFTLPVPDPPKSNWKGVDLTQKSLAQKALGFNCLDYSKDPEPSLYRHFLPDKSYLDANCKDGLRLELMFPSCWNGKDLDSSDHKSHMAYPDLVMTGDCPQGYETRLVSLFYETIWSTEAFAGIDGQFLLSNGDPTGYGYHGDFIAGWEPDFLQSAVKQCTNPSGEVSDCPLFNLQDETKAAQYTFSTPQELSSENPFFGENGIPGNVPIQSGPAYATHGTMAPTASASSSSASATSASASSSSQVVPTQSYAAGSSGVVYGATSSAQGIEYMAQASPSSGSTTSAVDTSVTAAAVPSSSGDQMQTTLITKGNTAYEVFIASETVTVTASDATVTATASTAVVTETDGASSRRRRHLHNHQHPHNAF
ncbi:hypothetical protein L228DRAFT_240704 [Xylona heveae TC161]|uniref:DUF1996 domain-containing protein n=1 Tax=Xylona heveae (strain CBS 132557 / TC161) TaxID=1328760 RepID=A0A165A9Y8_XYLHT|nr:hypothetical protein L228DRAFT_240704 [Xylona heveae TC161]KZF20149.1 hypothetical protein L228DRAFT_240704 [Xylona heveae TC161]